MIPCSTPPPLSPNLAVCTMIPSWNTDKLLTSHNPGRARSTNLKEPPMYLGRRTQINTRKIMEIATAETVARLPEMTTMSMVAGAAMNTSQRG